MEKYIKDLIKIFYILDLSAAVTNANNINGIEDETLSNCVIDIVKEGSTNRSLLDLTLVNVEDDLLVSSLHKAGGLRFTSRTFLFDSYRIFNSAYIIKNENPQKLIDGLGHLIRDEQWNPKARYIIIIKHLTKHDLLNLRNLFVDYNMDNVFLITTERRTYAIYQLKFTSNNYCRRFNYWVFVSYCSEYLTEKNLLILSSRESIGECQFKFITHNNWPFISFDNTNIEGIEQRIIKDFEEYKNVKIKFHTVMKKTDIHGIIIPGFIEDMLKMVQNNEFEGAVGGLVTFNSSIERLSYTYPVNVDHAIFVLARAENLGPWEFVIYCSYLYVTVGIIFIILCILVNFLNIFPTQGRDITRDILLVLGYILNKTGVKYINPKLPHRIIFFCLMLLALLLPYAINASIYSSVTKPARGFQPKNYKELKDYTFILNSEFAYKDPFIKNTCDTILNCLLKVKNDKKKSLFTVMSHTLFLAYGSQVTDDYCNKKVYNLGNAFLDLPTIFLRRGSFILDHYNKFILRIASAGLINKYIKDIAYSEDLKCQFHERNPMPINMNHMYVFYVILFIGYMISFIIFLLELIIATRKAY